MLPDYFCILVGKAVLCHKMGREEHVVESVPAKDDLIASSKLIDHMENLIPGVLRHETDERVQADNCLLIQMVENGHRHGIGMLMLISFCMNVLSRFKKHIDRHRYLLGYGNENPS
jgi:hypothetical protein